MPLHIHDQCFIICVVCAYLTEYSRARVALECATPARKQAFFPSHAAAWRTSDLNSCALKVYLTIIACCLHTFLLDQVNSYRNLRRDLDGGARASWSMQVDRFDTARRDRMRACCRACRPARLPGSARLSHPAHCMSIVVSSPVSGNGDTVCTGFTARDAGHARPLKAGAQSPR
jgi:hypothetical protein